MLSILLISLFVFLSFANQVSAIQYCTLDIYAKDQNDNPTVSDIYIDGSYKNSDDHITFTAVIGTHQVEARKSGYENDVETFTCGCSETRRVDLTLRNIERTDIRIGNLDIDSNYACNYEDETVRMSIPVTLEHGNDDTYTVAKFYVYDNDGNWHFIDKDEERLDNGETRTFSVDFHLNDCFLDEGTHDAKVIVESDNSKRTAFSDFQVNDCISTAYIDVGSIDVNNEFPNKGDIVQVSVPITLDYTHFSKFVYLHGYVDNNLVNSYTMKFDESGTKTYQFTIDTDKYSAGSHTIKVNAEVRGRTDTSTRTFSINYGYYVSGTEHCLSIDKVWIDGDLKAGENNQINVKVLSCGSRYENNVKMKLDAFSKTYYTGEFNIPSGGSKDAFVTINVPGDASEKQTFKVTVWNSYTSDTSSNNFVVNTGAPIININPEFLMEDCQRKRISFDVLNNGKSSDTFTISLTGPGADWVTGVPETITLNPGERRTMNAYMTVPCETEPGFYEFKITARGSPEYSVTSTIRVVRGLRWSIFPTGVFVVGGTFCWLTWILIILAILILLLFFVGYSSFMNNRRRPMFDCLPGSGHC
jgi:uncharacterized membrane protein